MRPVREIDPEFFAPDEALSPNVPLLDAWLNWNVNAKPLAGKSALLVQHQLSNQVPMLAALVQLGLNPARTWWLDIPYTSHIEVRDFASNMLGVPRVQLLQSDFGVLEPYAARQHARVIKTLLAVSQDSPGDLLVLDDGAYVLEALVSLAPSRRPKSVAIVEQTTRGLIKIHANAMLQRASLALPLVNVAGSEPKRTLEPPFIGMAVCAALQPSLHRHFGTRSPGRCLVLGYGAIGEQVATFLRYHFDISPERIAVADPSAARTALAKQRGFNLWDRKDFATCFELVIGCSGNASFGVGDAVYLEDGALLASASSGAVEMSREEFIEWADASPSDDIKILRDGLDESDMHADIRLQLVDRKVTFVNGGFPVNFNGRLTVCPARYIQPTPTMMVAATVQAALALTAGMKGVLPLDPVFCDWIDPAFRQLLGANASWLLPVPESAW